jgi:hypothetical protein
MPYGQVVKRPPRPMNAYMLQPANIGRGLSMRVFGFEGVEPGVYTPGEYGAGYGGGAFGDFWSDVYGITGAVSQIAGAVGGITSGQSKVAIVPSGGPSIVTPVPGKPYGVASPLLSTVGTYAVPLLIGGALLLMLTMRKR